MAEFGASFRKARQSRGISLEAISADTRISTRFLLAIENENFEVLPGGIFNRGFIRSYAERVGINPENALAAYERLTGVVEEQQPDDAVIPGEPVRIRRSDRTLYPLAIGALALLIAIFYFVNRS